MSDCLASNIGTIIVSLILVGIVAAIIVNIVKKKKAGRSVRAEEARTAQLYIRLIPT